MTLKPLQGFRSLEMHHCITGSMRHIYEFHKHPVSEELLLGLGAGVGFIYWHVKGTTPFYGGRGNMERPGQEGLELTAGKRLGVLIQYFRTSSARKAEKTLLEMLGAGEPVMLELDMGFLPYLNLPEGYHFGAHAVVVAGCDSETRMVLIADRDGELHAVTLDDLAKARGSTFKPFPPKHKWYNFDFSAKRPPEPEEVRQAVHEVVIGMLEPPIANFGVKGIRKAARLTLKWPEVMDEEELRFACFNIFVFIDAIGGTGGGIFRHMYSRFLREAAGISGDARFNERSDEFQRIGDKWQTLAEIFRNVSKADDPAAILPGVKAPLLELTDLEEVAWSRLGELVR